LLVLLQQNKIRNNSKFFTDMSLSTSSTPHGSHNRYSLKLYAQPFHSRLAYCNQQLSAIVVLRHVVDDLKSLNLVKSALQLPPPSSPQLLPYLLDVHAPDVNLKQENSELKILH